MHSRSWWPAMLVASHLDHLAASPCPALSFNAISLMPTAVFNNNDSHSNVGWFPSFFSVPWFYGGHFLEMTSKVSRPPPFETKSCSVLDQVCRKSFDYLVTSSCPLCRLMRFRQWYRTAVLDNNDSMTTCLMGRSFLLPSSIILRRTLSSNDAKRARQWRFQLILRSLQPGSSKVIWLFSHFFVASGFSLVLTP